MALIQRDRDAYGSMVGSAIAFRLFFFVVVGLILLVGAAGLLSGEDGIQRMVDTTGIEGVVAGQLEDAARSAHRSSWALVALGAVLIPWAGGELTLMLVAASAAAWRLRGRDLRVTARLIAAVTFLLVVLVGFSVLLSEARESGAVIPTAASLATAGLLYTLAWFGITFSLPRSASDPGALLPGAFLLGTVMTAAQWVLQFWLPGRISRSSEVVGTLGVSIAALGYFFVIGRIMTASLVLDAVVFERLGSISRFVFSLPGIRVLPRRWSGLRRFFDLGDDSGGEPQETC